MLTFSDDAKNQLNQIIKDQDSSTTGLDFNIDADQKIKVNLAELNQLKEDQEPLRDKMTNFFVEFEGFLLVVNPQGQKELNQGLVEFNNDQFELKAQAAAPGLEPLDSGNPLVNEIQTLLDKEINPGLAMHGGFAQLLSIKDQEVYLKFGGGCQGCSQIDVTVKQGVEQRIKQAFPQIKGVVDHTDHAAGSNPYFR